MMPCVCRAKVVSVHRAQIAVPVEHAKDYRLSFPALRAAFAVNRMLVLFFAADKRLVRLDNAVQRRIKRLGRRSMPEPVKHEPSGLLRHVNIPRQRRASDALLVRRQHPNRHQPLLQGYFGILKDCSNLDREAPAAITALMRPTI